MKKRGKRERESGVGGRIWNLDLKWGIWLSFLKPSGVEEDGKLAKYHNYTIYNYVPPCPYLVPSF